MQKISRCSGTLIWPPGLGPMQYCLVWDEFLTSSVVKGKEYKALSFSKKCEERAVRVLLEYLSQKALVIY